VKRQIMREQSAYVMQDDSHLALLTVRETFLYSALLRLPANMSKKEKVSRVDQVIHDLGLTHVQHTKIGGNWAKGISGGEKRRVSIGVQLLKDPSSLPFFFFFPLSLSLFSPFLTHSISVSWDFCVDYLINETENCTLNRDSSA